MMETTHHNGMYALPDDREISRDELVAVRLAQGGCAVYTRAGAALVDVLPHLVDGVELVDPSWCWGPYVPRADTIGFEWIEGWT